MTNYTILPNNIITSNVSDGAYRLYTMLLSMTYQKDYCYPSQSYMGRMLHKSVRTIQRYIKELKEVGLIKRIKRRGSISSVYYLKKEFSIKTEKLVNKVKETINKVKKSYPSNKKKSLFNSFKQRDYDFKELESQLLNGNYNPDKLIKIE